MVLVEPAVANICKEDQVESYCDFCFENIELHLIPCKSCAFAAYCSKKCLEKASGIDKNTPVICHRKSLYQIPTTSMSVGIEIYLVRF